MIDRLLSAAVSAAYHEWMLVQAPVEIWAAHHQVRREQATMDWQEGYDLGMIAAQAVYGMQSAREARGWEVAR